MTHHTPTLKRVASWKVTYHSWVISFDDPPSDETTRDNTDSKCGYAYRIFYSADGTFELEQVSHKTDV